MLVLASASPRRADLLGLLCADFSIAPAQIDETVLPEECPESYVQRMSIEKARAAASAVGESAAVLAADTSVLVDDRILGKPLNFAGFAAMMQSLSGREHRVLTSVSLLVGEEEDAVLSDSRVQFATLSKADIRWYWKTGEPADKAGGYGIQGLGGRFVVSIRGSYSGIVGLPLHETAALLARVGILNTAR